MAKKKNKAGIDKRFAKDKDYKQTLEDIIKSGKCPFCPENFKYHKEPILKEHEGWLATKNSWPYKNAKHHFIFVPKKHMEEFKELTQEDLKALKYLVNWITEEFKIKGGGVTMRFGEQTYTGASVAHLHAHLIVPEIDKQKNQAKPTHFPIG